jgi:hypothetical protein
MGYPNPIQDVQRVAPLSHVSTKSPVTTPNKIKTMSKPIKIYLPVIPNSTAFDDNYLRLALMNSSASFMGMAKPIPEYWLSGI